MTHLPPERLWIQQTLVPVEHHVIRLRLGANRKQKTASMGIRIEDGVTEELVGMWAGPVIPIEALEARSAMMLATVLHRLELTLEHLEPF